MTGDFSGRYIEQDLNESGVLYQQGRVFLDQDGNAQTRYVNRWQDTAGQDVIGAGVLAVPADDPNAFKVESAQVVGTDVRIAVDPGHAWADGLLVYEMGAGPVTRTATYLEPPFENPVPTVASIGAGVQDAVILEVWREALNAFQVPAELIEPALGGPDTTERVYTAMDLRLVRLNAGETCDSIAGRIADDFSTKGKLTVSLQPTVVIPGDCPVVEGGGYTGFEHNLYRIEIARVNAGPPMFKWSRFNGGLVGRGVFDAINGLVSIRANLQPIITSGLTSFYLETREFDPQPGAVNPGPGRWRTTFGAKVTLNANNELVIVGAPLFGSFATLLDPANPIFFRLWDDIRGIGEFPVQPNPNPLVDGILLQFGPAGVGNYIPEDFWTFTVRAGEISNPQVLINAQPPEGIHYHRVSLAELNWNAARNIAAPADIDDCRRPIQPLTRLRGCCTFTVGDGVQSHGDFASIQAAINALPNRGGEVCVLPGTYSENVRIWNRRSVILSGCGVRSLIHSPAPLAPATTADPVIWVKGSVNIVIRHLGIQADDTGVGVLLDGDPAAAGEAGLAARPAAVARVELNDLTIEAAKRSGIEAHVVKEVTIHHCTVAMKDQFSPWPGIFLIGDDCLIERNVVTVQPGERLAAVAAGGLATAGRGGIQIGGTSERVRIINNLIRRGMGNGITLGHLVIVDANNKPGGVIGWGIDTDDPCDPCRPGNTGTDGGGGPGGGRVVSGGALEEILIERNRIFDMGMNGIGVAGFFDLSKTDEFISIHILTFMGNDIRRNLQRAIAPISQTMLGSMGYGGIQLADVEMLAIRDNIIEDNGPNHLDPVCGIYVLHAEGMEATRNRILNNGAKTPSSPTGNTGASEGARAGIYAEFAIAPATPVSVRQIQLPGPAGPPAAVIQNNVVTQPLGQALRLVALGPVSVTSNELMTQEMVFRLQPLSPTFIASTVLLMNLGVGAELLGLLAAFTKAPPPVPAAPQPGLDDQRLLQRLVNGTIQFSDNQVTLSLLDSSQSLIFSSVMILTLDDVGFHDNQCLCDLTDSFVITNAAILSVSLRAMGNRLGEGVFNALFSGVTLGIMMNLTAQNQSTHCLIIRPSPPPPPTPSLRTVDQPNLVFMSAWTNKDLCGDPWIGVLARFGK